MQEFLHAFFIVIAACGALYFGLVRRIFDFFALAYFSALVYFLPGFFGYASYLAETGSWVETDLAAETYGVFIVVMVSVLLTSAAVPRRLARSCPLRPTELDAAALRILMLMTVAGAGLLVTTSWSAISGAEKLQVLDALGRWHIIFYSSAMAGLVLSYLLRRVGAFAFFCAALAFDVYIGLRVALVIGAIAVLLLYLNDRGAMRLFYAGRTGILIAGALAVVALGLAHVSFALKSGDFDAVLETLSAPDFLLQSLTHSEPFVIQNNLNEVILSRFATEPDHVLAAFVSLIPFSPEMGVEIVLFGDTMQAALFPRMEFGLASNIWAQMWSAGGWVLLFAFVAAFNVVLLLANRVFSIESPSARAALVVCLVFWAFYLHRNDLTYTFSLMKRPLIVVGVAYAAACVLGWLIRRLGSERSSAGEVQAENR
jgi:hypothetical protein